jgi:hypothetical protein
MEKAINSNAYDTLRGYLHPQVKIVDVEVKGKWLVATLSSGITFSIQNK